MGSFLHGQQYLGELWHVCDFFLFYFFRRCTQIYFTKRYAKLNDRRHYGRFYLLKNSKSGITFDADAGRSSFFDMFKRTITSKENLKITFVANVRISGIFQVEY